MQRQVVPAPTQSSSWPNPTPTLTPTPTTSQREKTPSTSTKKVSTKQKQKKTDLYKYRTKRFIFYFVCAQTNYSNADERDTYVFNRSGLYQHSRTHITGFFIRTYYVSDIFVNGILLRIPFVRVFESVVMCTPVLIVVTSSI